MMLSLPLPDHNQAEDNNTGIKIPTDHPFYSGPFSQGSRRCPASRVAYLEVQAVLASLLLDCKITGPSNDVLHWSDTKGKLQTQTMSLPANKVST